MTTSAVNTLKPPTCTQRMQITTGQSAALTAAALGVPVFIPVPSSGDLAQSSITTNVKVMVDGGPQATKGTINMGVPTTTLTTIGAATLIPPTCVEAMASPPPLLAPDINKHQLMGSSSVHVMGISCLNDSAMFGTTAGSVYIPGFSTTQLISVSP